MAIDFPNSPSLNQTFTVGQVTWKWDGSSWKSTSLEEIQYLQGVTSSIQTQLNARATLTGTQTLTNKTLDNSVIISPQEKWTVSATAATGTVNLDAITQGVLYYTTNASANFTLNFRGSVSVSLNDAMAIGQSITLVFLNTNGATAYYPNAFQVDGSTVTIKWNGGSAPSSGNTNSIDAYSFTVIKTANQTFTVLGTGPAKYA